MAPTCVPSRPHAAHQHTCCHDNDIAMIISWSHTQYTQSAACGSCCVHVCVKVCVCGFRRARSLNAPIASCGTPCDYSVRGLYMRGSVTLFHVTTRDTPRLELEIKSPIFRYLPVTKFFLHSIFQREFNPN